VSRAATFVFLIDDRFFGTLTAYVLGSEAADYRFTSSLPVEVLAILMPTLSPLLDGPEASRSAPAAATPREPPVTIAKAPAPMSPASLRPAVVPAASRPAERSLPIRDLRAAAPSPEPIDKDSRAASPVPAAQRRESGRGPARPIDVGSEAAEEERIHLP
jgi:hypothetical protein